MSDNKSVNKLIEDEKLNKEDKFKKCPSCKFMWKSLGDFLKDDDIEIIGYQASFNDLKSGLFLFNHSCKSTLAIKVSYFMDLYEGPIFNERATGSDQCPGYCLDKSALDTCPVKCECSYIREIIQILKKKSSSTLTGLGESIPFHKIA